MIAIKLSDKIMNQMPEHCGLCIYYGSRPHPFKGWTDLCELCVQCLDDDQEDGWIYDGDNRPKNCPLIEVNDGTKTEIDDVPTVDTWTLD